MPFHRLIPPEVLKADKDYHMFGLEDADRPVGEGAGCATGHDPGYWRDVQAKLAHHLTVPLPQVLSRHDPAKMEKKRKPCATPPVFFTNDIELLFAYACLSWDRDSGPRR